MKNSFAILLTLLLGSINGLVFGQSKGFKIYSDTKNHFSFEIPSLWEITNEADTTDSYFISTCRPTAKDEIEMYKECFDGIVFYILLYETNLDSTLQEEGYRKYGNTYYTTDRVNDSVVTKNINGINWSGIYHNNTCGISCKETGFHAAAGQCEFFYFSKGEITVCITTTGRELDEYLKNQLLKTFKFN